MTKNYELCILLITILIFWLIISKAMFKHIIITQRVYIIHLLHDSEENIKIHSCKKKSYLPKAVPEGFVIFLGE